MKKVIVARRAALSTVQHWSSLEQVAAALSLIDGGLRIVYVERLGTKYRWSFAHSGGPYALFRTVEAYLGVERGRLFGGFRTLKDGTTIQCENPEDFDKPDNWVVVPGDSDLSAENLEELLKGSRSSGGTKSKFGFLKSPWNLGS